MDSHFLAVGCSDNSVHVWDIFNSNMVLKVQSPGWFQLYYMVLGMFFIDCLFLLNEMMLFVVGTQFGAFSTQCDYGVTILKFFVLHQVQYLMR